LNLEGTVASERYIQKDISFAAAGVELANALRRTQIRSL